MKMKPLQKTRHPLADFVLGTFGEMRRCHDASTLAYDMAGGVATKAYLTVAKDVLESMEENGLLVRDGDGWYIPA